MHPHFKKSPGRSRSATAEDGHQQWLDDMSHCFEADASLYDEKIDPEASPVSHALASLATHGDAVGVAAVLAANPSLDFDIDGHGRYFQTPLHSAALSGSVECARILLDAGANPRQIDRYGSSPMESAASSSAPNAGDVCRLLASRGAAVDEPGLDGFTPFLLACRNAAPAAARALVELGANTAALGPQRQTAYSLAIQARGRRGPRRAVGTPSAASNRETLLDWLESIAERAEIMSDMATSCPPQKTSPRRI